MPQPVKVKYNCRDMNMVIERINEVGFFYDKEGVDFDFDIWIDEYGGILRFTIYGKLHKRKGI